MDWCSNHTEGAMLKDHTRMWENLSSLKVSRNHVFKGALTFLRKGHVSVSCHILAWGLVDDTFIMESSKWNTTNDYFNSIVLLLFSWLMDWLQSIKYQNMAASSNHLFFPLQNPNIFTLLSHMRKKCWLID